MPLHNPAAPAPITDLPTGWKAHAFERRTGMAAITLVSGRLHMSAVWLTAGTVVTTVQFQASTQAAATASHGWGALYDPSLNLLGQSANDTGITWAANAVKVFTLASPVTVAVTGWHYIGVCVVAGTMPTVCAARPDSAGVAGNIAQSVGGYSTLSGLTATAPNPAAALTAGFLPYGGVS